LQAEKNREMKGEPSGNMERRAAATSTRVAVPAYCKYRWTRDPSRTGCQVGLPSRTDSFAEDPVSIEWFRIPVRTNDGFSIRCITLSQRYLWLQIYRASTSAVSSMNKKKTSSFVDKSFNRRNSKRDFGFWIPRKIHEIVSRARTRIRLIRAQIARSSVDVISDPSLVILKSNESKRDFRYRAPLRPPPSSLYVCNPLRREVYFYFLAQLLDGAFQKIPQTRHETRNP